MAPPNPDLVTLADQLDQLADSMRLVARGMTGAAYRPDASGVAYDLAGDLLDHARELDGAADMARTWAEGIRSAANAASR